MHTQNDFIVVAYPEIESKYGILMQDYTGNIYFQNIPTAEEVYEDPYLNTFAVYNGNTRLKDLDLSVIGPGLSQPQNRAVLVIGDLEVEETIHMHGTDVGYPMYLYVTGNVRAKNIVISGLADVIIRGNTTLTESLFALDLSNGQLSFYGDFSAKYVYLEKFPLHIAGKADIPHLYYYDTADNGDDAATLAELDIDLAHTVDVHPVRCGESGIAYFEEMGQLNTGEIDMDDLDKTEQKKLEQKFLQHRIFVAAIYKREDSYDVNIHQVYKEIIKGNPVFL
ncbi:hypothetical protein [Chitinophaga nivalis]|uniref:Auto-transporter adhesin head GIN domain-containing protein n=1 Tax=Chitinophaga nivalis TaxID=2991709 RepID=A0ABT3IKD5_9BACT|nr:hypothetical protein [Chitinophaga nivalis]MCW3465888.1 hypothetical protein [Chitinophaga nivalis]MCW3484421.1 hypothetical protein [Chitinophaga nivalis]